MNPFSAVEIAISEQDVTGNLAIDSVRLARRGGERDGSISDVDGKDCPASSSKDDGGRVCARVVRMGKATAVGLKICSTFVTIELGDEMLPAAEGAAGAAGGEDGVQMGDVDAESC